jgi:soluble lytic murein transglycosylase-like protein
MLYVVLLLSQLVMAQEPRELRAQAYNIALEYKLDPHLFVAIIELESAFKVNAYNSKTQDYGLVQINLHNIRSMKLNRKRLLKDADYNLRAAASILQYMHGRYAYEPEWYCRYNVGVGRLKGFRKRTCAKYAWLVQQRLSSFLIANSPSNTL